MAVSVHFSHACFFAVERDLFSPKNFRWRTRCRQFARLLAGARDLNQVSAKAIQALLKCVPSPALSRGRP
jgi:hypothetical protein